MQACGLVLVAGMLATSSSTAASWPLIAPQSGVAVVDEAPDQGVKWVLKDARGRPAYNLTCKTGDSGDEVDFDYAGFVHCRLSIPGQQGWPRTLLQPEDSTRDWEGRARFLLGDVIGECARTPDYGAARSFRLRGMALHLRVDQVEVDPRANPFFVRRFRVAYEVHADATANAPTPAPVGPEPAWFNRDSECQARALSRYPAYKGTRTSRPAPR